MNKFTKISAATLFAVFLAACDKPAEKVETPAPAKQEATQAAVAEAPKTEEAKPSESKVVEESKMEVTKTESTQSEAVRGLEEFKKLLEWKQIQEQNVASTLTQLEKDISSQDQAKITQSVTAFNNKVNDVLTGLDILDIKSSEVNGFKSKLKENLVYLNNLITESVKAIVTPNAELQASVQEKMQLLQQSTTELNQIQMDLEKKFLNK